MKNVISVLSLTIIMFTVSCKTNSEKEEAAVENVKEADANLEMVNENLDKSNQRKANDAEWQLYKEEANITIADNEARIKELLVAMKKPGQSFDANYEKSIESLQQKNNDLKTKIKNYENNYTDWDTFKREVDSDMKGLGDAFRDLTINNKK